MNGILIVDKPEGFTSFDVVAKLRGILREKKIGHCGTLDPSATGVMTLLLGAATRFNEILSDHSKAYTASLKTGIVTDTLDITGKVIRQSDAEVTFDEFREAALGFRGEITQIPPMYSAVSVGGKRLYELARQGIETERPERKVTVYSLEALPGIEKGEFSLKVECSSGTYIRTLVYDIGEKLGCGATLTSLRRTMANGFTLDNAQTLEQIEALAREGRAGELIIPLDKALAAYKEITVTAPQAVRFSNGGELDLNRISGASEPGLYRVYGPDGRFLGAGENSGGECLKVRKVYTG